MRAKAWSGKKQEKVGTASSFTIVYEKSEGKVSNILLQKPSLGGITRHAANMLSRHTVCHAAKKAGDHTMNIFKGRKKTAFSCMHSSMAPTPKHTIFAL